MVLKRSRASVQRIGSTSGIHVYSVCKFAREQRRSKAECFARKQCEAAGSGWKRSGQIQYWAPFMSYAVEIFDGSLWANDARLATDGESSEVERLVAIVILDPNSPMNEPLVSKRELSSVKVASVMSLRLTQGSGASLPCATLAAIRHVTNDIDRKIFSNMLRPSVWVPICVPI
jgi:hypothetical protein